MSSIKKSLYPLSVFVTLSGLTKPIFSLKEIPGLLNTYTLGSYSVQFDDYDKADIDQEMLL